MTGETATFWSPDSSERVGPPCIDAVHGRRQPIERIVAFPKLQRQSTAALRQFRNRPHEVAYQRPQTHMPTGTRQQLVLHVDQQHLGDQAA